MPCKVSVPTLLGRSIPPPPDLLLFALLGLTLAMLIGKPSLATLAFQASLALADVALMRKTVAILGLIIVVDHGAKHICERRKDWTGRWYKTAGLLMLSIGLVCYVAHIVTDALF